MLKLAAFLVISIGVLLFLIMKLKVNASIALIVGSLIMGLGVGMPAMDAVSGIADGFGGSMRECPGKCVNVNLRVDSGRRLAGGGSAQPDRRLPIWGAAPMRESVPRRIC